MLYNPKECGERKKACPFFLLENSRPLSPWGPLDSLSTCLGTDSLKVKWTLGSITKNKASGFYDFGRPIQIPKGWCHQGFAFIMSANLEDPAVATGLEKVNPHANSQEG